MIKYDEKRTGYIKGIKIDWNDVDKDSYLNDIDSLKSIEELYFDSGVTFFVGENGTGKSTLIEAIAVAYGFNAEGGSRNYDFSTYASHSPLCDAVRIIRGPYRAKAGYFLRAESFYNVATKEEEYSDYAHPSMRFHNMSHGESFLRLCGSILNGEGVFIFDEPEAALSPQRQLALMVEIAECTKKGGQFLIATHSPILLGLPGAVIYSLDDGKIHECRYEETGSYEVTEMFINNRERMLELILGE